MCTHGFFTHIIEDAADLLQEGSEAGMRLAREAIHTFETQFITSKSVSTHQKRAVLLGQRSILRLLVKALEYAPAAETAAQVLYRIIVELAESPSDYASSHLESVSGQGMPNYLLFTLLRQLRPKCSPLASHLVLFLLHTAPDLIRPFFARVSVHMTEEGGSTAMGRVAASTARVATLNVMTRILQLPLPYHLAARQATLEPVATKVRTFYTMSPREVADEICPAWVAEYVHRLVNGSTNLLMLTFAMQLTQAALIRAQAVMRVVAEIQEVARRPRGDGAGRALGGRRRRHAGRRDRLGGLQRPRACAAGGGGAQTRGVLAPHDAAAAAAADPARGGGRRRRREGAGEDGLCVPPHAPPHGPVRQGARAAAAVAERGARIAPAVHAVAAADRAGAAGRQRRFPVLAGDLHLGPLRAAHR
ncbi:hypothetical protein STCU_11365 [Strigomonas culicis]|uniref:URB1 N-terminal domain-containing protein n=1 Tax=Strigomonas culicis TaxID=28005 RepID=S9V0M4_9TRYP|nr:hypothetical protein STCU_11365 [Strigomonas culicis]|eukprot:EPY16355.1 hypothetical protein STCU_11365 [Strigomonas culicis]